MNSRASARDSVPPAHRRLLGAARDPSGARRIAGCLLLLLVAGCRSESPEARLPALPELTLSSFEPAVREQFEKVAAVLRKTPEDAGANGKLGMLFDAYGWADAAGDCYERAATLAPQDFRWSYHLGRVRADQGDHDGALEALRRSHASRSDHLPTLLRLGDLCLDEGEREEARDWYARALNVSPQSPHARLGLGKVNFAAGDFNTAIEQYTEALRLAPELGSANYGLALAHRALGDADAARRHLEAHAEKPSTLPWPDPLLEEVSSLRRDSDHSFRTATALFKRGEFAAAERLFREVLQRNPSHGVASYNLGLTLQSLDRHEEAIPFYGRYLAATPDNVDGHNNLGLCFFHLGRYPEAVREITSAIEIDPDYHKGRLNLAMVYQRMGAVDKATEQYRRVIESRPDDAEAHLALGRIRLASGRSKEAVDHFLAILRHHPGHREAHAETLRLFEGRRRRASSLLQRNGLHAAAIHCLREGLRAGKDWRDAVALAWILATCPDERLRRPLEAVRLMEPICRDAAREDATALDTLATSYAAAGRFDDAERTGALALEIARRGTSPAAQRLAGRIAFRLDLFREGKAFHEK